jgi:uncharacterized protein (UPF0147 family)
VESSARAFQRDIFFYWSTVRANPLSLTKEGRLYQRDLRLINAALLDQQEVGHKSEFDVPRLIFMRRLLTNLGLLQQVGSTIEAIENPTLLAQTPGERIQLAFTRWRDGTFWNEILSIPNLTVRGVDSRLAPAPRQIVQARGKVLEHIAEIQKTQQQGTYWTSIPRLIERIRTNDYEFLLPREYLPFQSTYYRTYQNYLSHASPYISYGNEMGWSFSPPFEDEKEGWEVVEAGFIRATLLEPLHWMGLLDIGYLAGEGTGGDRNSSDNENDNQATVTPVAYRLTPVGAWALGMGPEVDMPEEKGRVVVQPNFELFALDPISDLTLAELDEFAERVNAERAIKYRLTRASVYRAQKKGWNAARIIDVLRELSQDAEPHTLPQNVVRTLQEWQGLHERVTIRRRANLLQAADAQLLEQLRQDPAICTHLDDRVDGEESQPVALTLIQPGLAQTEELIQALEHAGYPPMRTRSSKDAMRPSLIVADERETSASGIEIHFHVALPSIYVHEQIAPFTRQDEQRRTYLTPLAIDEAVRTGMGVDEILERLSALHYGPLPHAVVKQVRAWGHYYGDAALQTVTLIQIQDAKTLNELLADPKVSATLRPFVPDPGKVLAFVDADDLDWLYEALARYGITLHDQLVHSSLEVKDSDPPPNYPTA